MEIPDFHYGFLAFHVLVQGKCGEVTGSADGLFAPGLLKKKESFSLWSTDACRTLSFSRWVVTRMLIMMPTLKAGI